MLSVNSISIFVSAISTMCTGISSFEKYIEAVTNVDGTPYETDIVSIESNVNTSKPGVYEVIYTAEDGDTIKGFTALLVVVE